MPSTPEAGKNDGNVYDRIQGLTAEVERLQTEMAKIHGTDTKAVQRALTSLCQHVDALNLESKGMSQGIGSFETDLVTPDCIAEELTTLGLLTGGLVGVHHLIRLTPFKDITALYRGFWVAGAVYMTWRLGSGALRRLAAITLNNRRRKRELQNIWAGVDERIQIMQSLASTAPAVSQSQHAQMPSMPAASQSLPHASHPPVEDLSGANASFGAVDTFPGAAKTRTALAAERMAQAGALSREKASLAED